jgi:hypothetical protein
MESMRPFDREALDETEFERRLLASARADPEPHDLQGAWARLAGALGPVVSDPALGGGRGVASGGPAAPSPVSATHARLAPAAAMKWMLLGAIAGGAATTAVLSRPHQAQVVASSPAFGPASSPAAGPLEKAVDPRPGPLVQAPAGETSQETSAPLHAARAKRAGEGRPHAPQAKLVGADSANEFSSAGRTSSSGLAAEVARLDAARTSNARGDYDETIQLIERYHRDFPDGALAPDADVVALEAVAAKRDRGETARRAALFLSRYPGDPHAARVRSLAEH